MEQAQLAKIKFRTQAALQSTSVGDNSSSNDCRRMPGPVIVLLLVLTSGDAARGT
jgi:hypothetical protein